ncbi:hypothetical protein HZB94_04400 [Candidatus Falkowbacteria bacterium]|nr:hypothetical protein [Candidatus Falkowbacteria bacterium]
MLSLCEQIKTEYEQLQILEEQLILEYEKVKDSDDMKDWSVVKKLQAEWEAAYANLEAKLYISVERARELLGRENVLGPEEVEKTWGVRLEKVPEIPFSVTELARARELGQMLVLRVDRTADGKPLSIEAMNYILVGTEENPGKWKREEKGDLLNTPNGCRRGMFEEAYTKDAPRPGWALVSKDLLPKSWPGLVHEQQIELIVEYLKDKVFKDMEMPEEYVHAITEWNAKKKILSMDLMESVKQLSELKISQLTMQTIQETIYDLAMYYNVTGIHLLSNEPIWSSNDGGFMDLGRFSFRGINSIRWTRDYRYGDAGVCFSRRL